MADVGIGHDGLSQLPTTGRLLAVDVGDVRVGLAVSDTTQAVATPLDTVAGADDTSSVAASVADVARQRDASAVVVGYPRTMAGREGAAARRCRQVAEQVGDRTGLPVVLWDERFSTVEAERMLLDADLRRRRRREVVDRVAASLILQGVLEARRIGRGGS